MLMPDITLNAQLGDDIGEMIQRCVDDLPDRSQSWSTDGTQTIRVSSVDCKGGPDAPFDLSQRTKVVIPPEKQVAIKGTGPHGIRINNDIPNTDGTQFEAIGEGVGQSVWFEDLSTRGGNIVFTNSVRGKSGVKNVQAELAGDYAVKFVDGADDDGADDGSKLGPTAFIVENLWAIGCKGSVDVSAATVLISRIVGGRSIASTDIGMRLSGRDVHVTDHHFTGANGRAYIHMHGETDSTQFVKVERANFGSESVADNATAGTSFADRPPHDIIIGSLDGSAPANPASSIDIWNNTFSGGSLIDGTAAQSAILVNDRPRQIRVMNGNQFDSDYQFLIEEGWLPAASTNPSTASSGERAPRNYWGVNRIATGSNVFSNGGVGWHMPFIDMNFADYGGPTPIRMMSPNGQHYLLEVDNSGNPVTSPVGYV